MFALRIDDQVMTEITELARQQHTSRSSIVRQAVMRFLEDTEDLKLAKKSKLTSTSSKSLSEIRRELGLDD